MNRYKHHQAETDTLRKISGLLAFRAGKSACDNPYPANTRGAASWAQGYMAGVNYNPDGDDT